MAGFKFERDLPHQNAAISGVLRALDGIEIAKSTYGAQNPEFLFSGQSTTLLRNISNLKKEGNWAQDFKTDTNDVKNLIFDISMETGTGKTYVYTKTMLELHKRTGVSKFIIAVPRVAIKAGTVGFLKSPAAKEHFREEFGCEIKTYEVKSQKSSKNKREYMPQAITDFCRADSHMNTNTIHVLVINSGMITSKTMEKAFDVALFDKYNIPHEAIANTRPILIIDEPHTFKRSNTTYKQLMRFKPQFTLRYGATFDGDLTNLVYELNAVDAFNQDLVKGITVHMEEFKEGQNIALRFVSSDEKEAVFELNENGKKTRKTLAKKDSFQSVHPEMKSLYIESLKKTKLILSNGLEMKKGDSINPYSYAETLQDKMVKAAIVAHFENERNLILASPKIKPITLFFIDNIESYRDKDGQLRTMFENLLASHIKDLIAKEKSPEYKAHLQNALHDISLLHGGYFSQDNSEKDEKIEQETLEILHDKEELLKLSNPRRFVFSKWTLREGWDNPNVFVICKLRSSGSDTSKLQEVGRGLRLPVNEYMSRDHSSAHELHYFVDFTEKDFVQTLVGEINEKSAQIEEATQLTDILKQNIIDAYPDDFSSYGEVSNKLGELGLIDFSQKFKEGGLDTLKELYPLAFGNGLKKGKVKKSGAKKSKAVIRKGKYQELKSLWETINQKVVLEYKVENAEQFRRLFADYMDKAIDSFKATGSETSIHKMKKGDQVIHFEKEETLTSEILPFSTMSYSAFVKQLSMDLALSISTIHNVMQKIAKNGFPIEKYFSQSTIRTLKKGFNDYLLEQSFAKFTVGFKQVHKSIHPTKFTNAKGEVKESINSSDVGVLYKEGTPPESYFFEDIFYDGQLELENIEGKIKEVVVYAKIPKNSIRIPLVGGGTYSPDFAYVVKYDDKLPELNLIVETKGKDDINLSKSESSKIEHAQRYFNGGKGNTKVIFKKQLNADKITDIIKACLDVEANAG